MNDLKLSLQSEAFSTDQTLSGTVEWSSLSEGDTSISIRLIWFTEGKGDRDYQTVDLINLLLSKDSSGADFEFVLPRRPLSFSGKLICLKWAVEAVVKPSNQSILTEFSLVNGPSQIVLADKSDQLKELGMSKPFFSIGQAH